MEKLNEITAEVLDLELDWLQKVINTSLTLYFKNESDVEDIYQHSAPPIDPDTSEFGKFVMENNLSFEERIVLILGLCNTIRPASLDVFLIKNQNLDTVFSEFGGQRPEARGGFLPTLETAIFILGGYETHRRLELLSHFGQDHFLYQRGVLHFEGESDNYFREPLNVSSEYLGLFLFGKKQLPQYNSKFPAKEISTNLDWEHLIVDANVMNRLQEIRDWQTHSSTIMDKWKLRDFIKPGYRALFFGPPGTGKTMATTLLGKSTGKPVFRVDLSLVVSKYIGETEKNLGRLFDEAEYKDWILFFDEADALFGKRTQTKGANDRYANQEVAYLLQRIEDFSGLIILATNIQSNLDEAFSRRFQSTVYFPRPKAAERKRLWTQFLKNTLNVAKDVNIEELAKEYELTGGEMINVLRYCALSSAKRKKKTIQLNDILEGIRREYIKSNKTL